MPALLEPTAMSCTGRNLSRITGSTALPPHTNNNKMFVRITVPRWVAPHPLDSYPCRRAWGWVPTLKMQECCVCVLCVCVCCVCVCVVCVCVLCVCVVCVCVCVCVKGANDTTKNAGDVINLMIRGGAGFVPFMILDF
jgi:hypothetical protein